MFETVPDDKDLWMMKAIVSEILLATSKFRESLSIPCAFLDQSFFKNF